MKIIRVLVYEGTVEQLRRHLAQRHVVYQRVPATDLDSIKEFYMPSEDLSALLICDDELRKQVEEQLK